MGQAGELVKAGVKVVDLSADFRLKNTTVFEHWYCQHSDPELLQKAVYGLTELNREAIKTAQLIANPGCYPTSIQLPLAPLLYEGLIETKGIFIDSKSGVSGAGKSLSVGNLYTENDENFRAYGVAGHRHLPEIEQELSHFADEAIQVTFVPHLLPMTRGIESTIYCQLKEGIKLTDIYQVWQKKYAQEDFISIRENTPPATKEVRGTNRCAFSAVIPQQRNTLVISSVIDNLVKGASGQAVQNMNIMLGLDETLGLGQIPLLA
jgi:N-acetyl-gamma-glutamyl-phosphate reductase